MLSVAEDSLWPSEDELLASCGSGEKVAEVGSNPQNEQKEVAAADAGPVAARPPSAAKGKKRSNAGGKDGAKGSGVGDSDHELHLWTERKRRKKMKNMFQGFLDLLPHLSPKVDKSTIVDEGMKYIKELQTTLANLEKQKMERLHGFPSRAAFLANRASGSNIPNLFFSAPTAFKTWASPNVTMNISGNEAHISVCALGKPGLLTAICFVLEKYRLDVVCAHVSTDYNRCMYMIHTNANYGASDPVFSSMFPAEEIYKQVVSEIMLLVN